MIYLLDTSVIARLNQKPVLDRIETIGAWNCRISAVVLLEIGYVARDIRDYRDRRDSLTSAFAEVTASPWAQQYAVELQEQLAAAAAHRSARLGDLLIAATAIQIDAIVLHYDRDFETLNRLTGVPAEWVAPAGTLDQPTSG